MPGLIRGVARTAVVAGTATAVSNRVSRRQADRWAQQEGPQYANPRADLAAQQAPAAQPAPEPGGGTDTITMLKQLGELRDSGVLTEQEFAAQKAKILAG